MYMLNRIDTYKQGETLNSEQSVENAARYNEQAWLYHNFRVHEECVYLNRVIGKQVIIISLDHVILKLITSFVKQDLFFDIYDVLVIKEDMMTTFELKFIWFTSIMNCVSSSKVPILLLCIWNQQHASLHLNTKYKLYRLLNIYMFIII